MGLDMYLLARRSFSSESAERKQLMDIMDIAPDEVEEFTSINVSFCVAYWRKANQIHNWFVKNVQNGKDDCGEYYVEREQLQKLLNICEYVLQKKDDFEVAKEVLPTSQGFFFGDSQYNDSYYDDLQRTIDKLINILTKEKYNQYYFLYRASW